VNRWESGVPWPRQLGFGEVDSAVSISAGNVTIAESLKKRLPEFNQKTRANLLSGNWSPLLKKGLKRLTAGRGG
jgi:hypothetical protein